MVIWERKGETIRSRDQGESLKMVLHTSLPSAISCQESPCEPVQLCILNTPRKCMPLTRETFSRDQEPRSHDQMNKMH